MAQAKYLQVKEDILKKIQIGKLCPMDMLPSENALCQEYSIDNPQSHPKNCQEGSDKHPPAHQIHN